MKNMVCNQIPYTCKLVIEKLKNIFQPIFCHLYTNLLLKSF